MKLLEEVECYKDCVLPENVAIHDKKVYINCDNNIRVINLDIITGKHPVQQIGFIFYLIRGIFLL